MAGGTLTMGRKKSESRKHTEMLRVTAEAKDRATLAASMMKLSLADYVSVVLMRVAEDDIQREAAKLVRRPKGGA